MVAFIEGFDCTYSSSCTPDSTCKNGVKVVVYVANYHNNYIKESFTGLVISSIQITKILVISDLAIRFANGESQAIDLVSLRPGPEARYECTLDLVIWLCGGCYVCA